MNTIEPFHQMNNNITSPKKQLDFVQFKKFFLLEFTKQLIKHSMPSETFKLQIILKKEEEDKQEEAKEIIKNIIKEKGKEESQKFKERKTKEIDSPFDILEKKHIPHINPLNIRPNPLLKIPQRRIRLSIPESRFPPHIQYIRPVPMEKEIELGKVNPLIRDPNVRIIECYGPEENLVVQGNMGTKKTGIILDKEEIDSIIQRFSRETRIPIQEGIFKVVAGKLIFLAIISEIVGSKFIIKKMLREQQPNYRM